jgi:hypothetical protein
MTGRPRPVSSADREAFDTLVKESTSSVRSMAAAWRTGLAALITLVTTGIIITGRTATTTLTVPWRSAVTAAVGGGLTLALVGLWLALSAEAGARVRLQTLDGIRSQHGSVEAYLVGQAAAASRRLQAAKNAVGIALGLLVAGVLLTWWAPAAPASPPAYLRVAIHDGVVCGSLRSADSGFLRLNVAGANEPAAIPLTMVTNIAVVARCP